MTSFGDTKKDYENTNWWWQLSLFMIGIMIPVYFYLNWLASFVDWNA